MLYNVFLVKIAFEKPHPLRFFQKKKKKENRVKVKQKVQYYIRLLMVLYLVVSDMYQYCQKRVCILVYR